MESTLSPESFEDSFVPRAKQLQLILSYKYLLGIGSRVTHKGTELEVDPETKFELLEFLNEYTLSPEFQYCLNTHKLLSKIGRLEFIVALGTDETCRYYALVPSGEKIKLLESITYTHMEGIRVRDLTELVLRAIDIQTRTNPNFREDVAKYIGSNQMIYLEEIQTRKEYTADPPDPKLQEMKNKYTYFTKGRTSGRIFGSGEIETNKPGTTIPGPYITKGRMGGVGYTYKDRQSWGGAPLYGYQDTDIEIVEEPDEEAAPEVAPEAAPEVGQVPYSNHTGVNWMPIGLTEYHAHDLAEVAAPGFQLRVAPEPLVMDNIEITATIGNMLDGVAEVNRVDGLTRVAEHTTFIQERAALALEEARRLRGEAEEEEAHE